MNTNIKDRIEQLRKLMKNYSLDAYIIPSGDPHIGEYVADYWKARSWLSGFTGSAGTVVITKDECGLWTDGRYFIQAENQLAGTGIKLFKMNNSTALSYIEWLESVLKKGDCVGCTGEIISVATNKNIEKSFFRKGIKINNNHDLISEIWKDRPNIPSEPVFIHDLKFAGLTAAKKIEKVKEEMKKVSADYYVISSLDDIAWLYNIRGGDMQNIPVTICYALVSMSQAFLFINHSKISHDVQTILSENCIHIMEYDEITKKLSLIDKNQKIVFDPNRTNCRLYNSINPDCNKEEIDEITNKLKSVKNEVELVNIKECQVSDGIAMVKFLFWLEKNIGRIDINEITVADKLKQLRGQQKNNIGESFSTIAGYKDHGAIIHYKPTKDSSYKIENEGLMVLDSGGQYLNGTTDITRTIVFDSVNEEEIFDFTMVLKSHISLSSAKFLYGSTGSNIDILARKPLWDARLDYKHGTGHGVGYCLSVHEGPQSISQNNKVILEKGMLLTIEPGIYKEGKHGIRIENMVLIVEGENTEYGQFFKFEPLTLCPISLKGINPDLLTIDEKIWLNDYHRMVYELLSQYLDDEEKEWLKINTRSI